MPVERRGTHWWLHVDGVDVRLSNLDKIFWPQEKITKGDVVAYYYNVARWLLPHVDGRPLAMKRMPEGVEGPSFFEDAAPAWTPDWVTRCDIESEDGDVDRLVVADSTATLAFLANSGCIDLHPFHSACERYDSPDYLVFDLDPSPPATFDDSAAVAKHVHVALKQLDIDSFAKTSGATGMQIFARVDPNHSYEETRALARAIARLIVKVDPERATAEWSVDARAGKVFIDANMNRRAASLASVYSVRPVPGARVSAPVTLEELEDGVDPAAFTIETIFERLAARGDLFGSLLTRANDLSPALDALGVRSHAPEPNARVRRLIRP
jgi:bifunctional non-homologous end joining protein LigD